MRTPSSIRLAVIFLLMPAVGSASASAVSFGSLDLTTEPNTTILWDGHLLGTTDDEGRMTISSIPLGQYSMTFRKEGFEDLVQEIEIIPGNQILKQPVSVPVEPALPDPFAKQSTSLTSVAFVVFLVAIAAGALWLGRRRRSEPEAQFEIQPEGPRVVLAKEPRGRRRPPGFYEDLRQRETVLETLEERGPERPRPKIIEIPVSDHHPVEGEN